MFSSCLCVCNKFRKCSFYFLLIIYISNLAIGRGVGLNDVAAIGETKHLEIPSNSLSSSNNKSGDSDYSSSGGGRAIQLQQPNQNTVMKYFTSSAAVNKKIQINGKDDANNRSIEESLPSLNHLPQAPSLKNVLNLFSTSNIFVPDSNKIQECSKGMKSYCSHIDGYPKLHVENLLKSKGIINDFFGVDMLINEEDTKKAVDLMPPDLRQNMTDDPSLCRSTEKIIFPKIAATRSKDWRFILQSTDESTKHLKQGVRVETCINCGEPCAFSEHAPTGYKFYCSQKYIQRTMAAIQDDGTIYYDDFILPSCCVCKYKQMKIPVVVSNV